MKPISIVMTTLADRDAARELVEALHERGVIACGHVLPPGESFFRWDGDKSWETEVTVLLKTRADCAARLVAAVTELHPYVVPEILAFAVAASDGYADWVESEVKD
ncbi:MAG: divalent-cation tolerance protein CutA [bacterium]|jgi:periplasmic divalent cation tolerance protein